VTVRKIIHAEQTKVFDAWTKADLMNQWFVGGPGKAECSVDLRIGGKYKNRMCIEGEATCASTAKTVDGKNYYDHHGEYLEISPPSRLVFTWNSPAVQSTKVTVEFRAVSSGTEVTITHELLDKKDCEGHIEGWTFALSSLASFLG
jgi:uncharacterized protein YndB with AHSA1/START domain